MTSKHDILDFLTSQKQYLFSLGITKLGLFGSYAKDEADMFSDIDITIETDAKKMAKELGDGFAAIAFLDDFKTKVANYFKTKVDLCDTTSMPTNEKNRLIQGAIYV